MHHYALTVIGRDRPGIVADVAAVLFRLGANIADSSCTLLGGQFAMIVMVAHPTLAAPGELAAAFAGLAEDGLSTSVRAVAEADLGGPEIAGDLAMISVYGADRPGIVYRVTSELAARGINITDLETKLIGSEARPVYVMMLEVVLPAGVDEEAVRQVAKGLEAELKVDITVRPITPVEL